MAPISRRWFSVTFVGGMSGLCVGCLSPTLPPLPPPNAPEVTVLSNDRVELAGSLPEERAHVLALNVRTGVISGEAVTAYDYRFSAAARAGDTMLIWFVTARHTSPATEFVIAESQARDAGDASEPEPDGAP